jgi:hypothetical protein
LDSRRCGNAYEEAAVQTASSAETISSSGILLKHSLKNFISPGFLNRKQLDEILFTQALISEHDDTKG